eukprot:GEMP01052251.1.p1 GENE.GEMP01052251.1~~GEMP01052251.1.p1  ORF type:complete len:491 (+),score=96.52 GEMP01052251.1:34-1473(+)
MFSLVLGVAGVVFHRDRWWTFLSCICTLLSIFIAFAAIAKKSRGAANVGANAHASDKPKHDKGGAQVIIELLSRGRAKTPIVTWVPSADDARDEIALRQLSGASVAAFDVATGKRQASLCHHLSMDDIKQSEVIFAFWQHQRQWELERTSHLCKCILQESLEELTDAFNKRMDGKLNQLIAKSETRISQLERKCREDTRRSHSEMEEKRKSDMTQNEAYIAQWKSTCEANAKNIEKKFEELAHMHQTLLATMEEMRAEIPGIHDEDLALSQARIVKLEEKCEEISQQHEAQLAVIEDKCRRIVEKHDAIARRFEARIAELERKCEDNAERVTLNADKIWYLNNVELRNVGANMRCLEKKLAGNCVTRVAGEELENSLLPALATAEELGRYDFVQRLILWGVSPTLTLFKPRPLERLIRMGRIRRSPSVGGSEAPPVVDPVAADLAPDTLTAALLPTRATPPMATPESPTLVHVGSSRSI